ncbi:MAG: class I SAM-dependent methyltransferase [Candidatus Nanohalobium sp.]
MSELSKKFYSKWSFFYSLVFENPPVIRGIRKEAVQSLELDEGDTVVELGCGTGANLRYMRDQVGSKGKIIGIDISPGMLEKAKKKKRKNEWENVELIEADASSIELEEELDAVLTSFSICMFDEPEKVIEKWNKKLDGGRFTNLVISRSDRDTLLPVNFFVDIFEILTAPTSFKEGLKKSLPERHEKCQKTARQKLEAVSHNFKEKEFVLGIIKYYSGSLSRKAF